MSDEKIIEMFTELKTLMSEGLKEVKQEMDKRFNEMDKRFKKIELNLVELEHVMYERTKILFDAHQNSIDADEQIKSEFKSLNDRLDTHIMKEFIN